MRCACHLPQHVACRNFAADGRASSRTALQDRVGSWKPPAPRTQVSGPLSPWLDAALCRTTRRAEQKHQRRGMTQGTPLWRSGFGAGGLAGWWTLSRGPATRPQSTGFARFHRFCNPMPPRAERPRRHGSLYERRTARPLMMKIERLRRSFGVSQTDSASAFSEQPRAQVSGRASSWRCC